MESTFFSIHLRPCTSNIIHIKVALLWVGNFLEIKYSLKLLELMFIINTYRYIREYDNVGKRKAWLRHMVYTKSMPSKYLFPIYTSTVENFPLWFRCKICTAQCNRPSTSIYRKTSKLFLFSLNLNLRPRSLKINFDFLFYFIFGTRNLSENL